MALATVELLGSVCSANSSTVTLWFPVSTFIVRSHLITKRRSVLYFPYIQYFIFQRQRSQGLNGLSTAHCEPHWGQLTSESQLLHVYVVIGSRPHPRAIFAVMHSHDTLTST